MECTESGTSNGPTVNAGSHTPPGHKLQGRNLDGILRMPSVLNKSLFSFRIEKNLALNRNLRSFRYCYLRGSNGCATSNRGKFTMNLPFKCLQSDQHIKILPDKLHFIDFMHNSRRLR